MDAAAWASASGTAAARKAPKLQGDPRSLWRGRFPDKPPVTEPRFYAMGTDGRLFRDELPAARELLPFVVAVDGNPEDGYGGYVLGCAGGEWSFERRGDTFAVAGKDAFAFTFDGTWLAGLQAAARAKPSVPDRDKKRTSISLCIACLLTAFPRSHTVPTSERCGRPMCSCPLQSACRRASKAF